MSAAVCLVGRLTGYRTTVPLIREHLLEPWRADAFLAVSEPITQQAEQQLRSLLGERLKYISSHSDQENIWAQQAALSPLWDTSFLHRLDRAAQWNRRMGRIYANRKTCFLQVMREEKSKRSRYAAYARLRIDIFLAQPVPLRWREMLVRDASAAVVPAGEDYGAANGLNDRLLFGGARAFEADASCWDTLVNSSLPLHQAILRLDKGGWISETMQSSALNAMGVRVLREPLAYCVTTMARFCKYPTELSASVELVPSLLTVRPHLCPPLLTKPNKPCRPSRNVELTLRIPPLPPGFASDPGLCGLESKCANTSAASARRAVSAAAASARSPPVEVMQGVAKATMKELACAASPTTDKVTAHAYDLMYEAFLIPLARSKQGVINMLEIGLGCDMYYGGGASARLWRRLLPKAELWEAEVDGACVEQHRATLEELGVRPLVGSQASRETLRRWVAESGGGFDVIIDDGSHKNTDLMKTFEELWPALAVGGRYFLEDLQVGRHTLWDDSEGRGVMSDVLKAWMEQLVIRGDVPGRRQGLDSEQHWAAEPASRRSKAERRAHPLPPQVAFVFCQAEACVIGKQAETQRTDEYFGGC